MTFHLISSYPLPHLYFSHQPCYNIRLSSIIYPLAPHEHVLRFNGDGSVYKNSVWEMSSLNILLPTPAVR